MVWDVPPYRCPQVQRYQPKNLKVFRIHVFDWALRAFRLWQLEVFGKQRASNLELHYLRCSELGLKWWQVFWDCISWGVLFVSKLFSFSLQEILKKLFQSEMHMFLEIQSLLWCKHLDFFSTFYFVVIKSRNWELLHWLALSHQWMFTYLTGGKQRFYESVHQRYRQRSSAMRQEQYLFSRKISAWNVVLQI